MIFKLLPLFSLFTLLLASTPDMNKCVPTHLQLSLGDTYYSMARPNDLRLPSEHINDNQAYLVFQSEEPCQYLIHIQKADDDQVLIEKPVDYVHNPNSIEDEIEEVEKSLNSDPIIYNVLLENLAYETQYQYTIFDHEANPVAGPLKFRLTDPHTLDGSRKILIAGSLSNQEQAITTINQLSSLASSNYQDYAAFLQLGNIHLENVEQQENYEKFLETIRSFTSVIPSSISVDGTGDFKQQPIRNPLYDMTHNHYFSFNLQGIHFVSINFDYYESSPSEIRTQIDRWLENDLEQANDAAHRKLWPWIVALTNEPVYCGSETCETNQEQQKKWGEFFSSYKVDLVVSGNVGEYQKLGPQDEDTAPVYIIEGAGQANNSETENKPGYGMILIQNNTDETKLIYEHYDSETQTKIDSLTIQKTYNKKTEEVVVPKEETQEEEKDVIASISNNSINITLISMIALGIGIIVAAVVGVIIWRKKKGTQEDDPEVEGLKKSELRSNKIYTNKKTDKSIPMVDLVL